MITSASDDMIIVWDLVSGSILRRIGLETSGTFPLSIQLASDALFVCGQDGIVRIVNMITGRVAHTISNFCNYDNHYFRCKC
jgi:WD40 repeat protein